MSYTTQREALRNHIAAQLDATIRLGADPKQVAVLAKHLNNVVDSNGNIDLLDEFDFIAHGSFKACFDCYVDGWVIKFYSAKNPTASEEYILEAAEEEGAIRCFIPSFYVEFPFSIPSNGLLQNEEDNSVSFFGDDVSDSPFVGFILQPAATILSDCELTYYSEDEYLTNPLPGVTYEEISEDFGLDPDRIDWVWDIYAAYGRDVLRDFLQFLKKYQIDDLHEGNVGYWGDKPVVLDWLSASYAC